MSSVRRGGLWIELSRLAPSAVFRRSGGPPIAHRRVARSTGVRPFRAGDRMDSSIEVER